MPRTGRVLLGACALFFLLPRPLLSQDVPRFYEENCSACHSIGGGAQSGPDLKGITSRVERPWLIRFMLDPEAVIHSGDPYALKILKEWDESVMPPTEGLTPELAEAILRYIEGESGAPDAAPAPTVTEAASTPERLSAGRALFVGTQRLSTGGPACIGCHRMSGLPGWNGGRLGPDLTEAHARLRGRAGAAAWLANPPTPVMKGLYRQVSMSSEEREALAAFFAVPPGEAPAAPRRRADLQFAGTGILGALLLAGVFAVVWRARFTGVREPFLDRAKRRVSGDQR
jgi:mono/diheme cytochrome c family protein